MTDEQNLNTNTETKEDNYFNLGLELYNNKEPYDKVIETFELGLRDNPRDSSYYTCLSWLYLFKNDGNDRKKSINLAKTALKYDPTNTQAQFNLVLAYLFNGRSGIREEFEKAIAMSKDQDLDAAKTNLKEIMDREGEIPEVQKLLKWIENA